MAGPDSFKARVVWLVRALVSFCVLVPCLYIVVVDPDPAKQTWATGTVGLIIGFWLR